MKVIRAAHPDSKIFSLSAFVGAYPEALRTMIEEYNAETGDSVIFIDSKGWIPEEPLHPHRDGHEIVARHLTEELKKYI